MPALLLCSRLLVSQQRDSSGSSRTTTTTTRPSTGAVAAAMTVARWGAGRGQMGLQQQRRPRCRSHLTPAAVRRRWVSSGGATATAASRSSEHGDGCWQAAALWAGGGSWASRYPRPAPRVSLGPAGSVPLVSDADAGFDIRADEFTRFNQKNDAFSRSWWDTTYQDFCGGEARVMSFYNR